jgi:pimeloyl-ACP methyl ester carboxylesterase
MKIPFFGKPDFIVIGIHGLLNKPPKRLLKRWWIASIREGFALAGLQSRNFSFELVYWADCLYSKPLDINETREGHPRFLDEPYIPSTRTAEIKKKKKPFSSFMRFFFRKTLDRVFLSTKMKEDTRVISEDILDLAFPDLAHYYANKRVFSRKTGARDLLRKKLCSVIKKYSGSEILLIAHSMGSIISFDVLSDNPHAVDTLVTAGSPLGQPFVRKQFADERSIALSKKNTIAVPETIRNGWFNLADAKDMVAFITDIADGYSKNSRGIAPKDINVFNDYIYNDHENHHNICGYLRTPEMARILHEFVSRQEVTLWERIRKLF